MTAEQRGSLMLPGLALAAALVALVVALVWRAQTPPEGAVEPAWDRTACARCRMLVSDPRFAAQLHTPSGAVLHFDDPGCALLHAAEHPDDVHALWFHHVEEDRWLPGDQVGFLPVSPTPMGYGLGAVGADDAAALPLQAARERVVARDAVRAPEPAQGDR